MLVSQLRPSIYILSSPSHIHHQLPPQARSPHNLMQQQISIDIGHLEEPDHNPVADSLSPSEEGLISQHYEEDFDSISDHPPPSPQIQEELYQSIDQVFEPLPEEGASDRQEDQEQQRLKQQIEHFKDEIANLQQKLAEKLVESTEEGHQQRARGIEDLLAAQSRNEQVLSSQNEEIRAAIANVIGKEAVSIDLLLSDQHSGKMVEEQLLEEAVRLNALLHCTGGQIAKLKRIVKQNGDELAVADEATEETRSKHHLLFREIQEKKQRNERNNEKIAEMEMKIIELKQKIGTVSEGELVESKGSELKSRWQILWKEKEKELKRNLLLQKSTQNSCTATSRILLELKRQIQQVSTQIGQLDQKNLKMEEKSEALLSQFNRETNDMSKSKRYGKKKTSNHFFTQDQQIPVPTPPPYYLLGRKRNFSVQNREHQGSQSQSKGLSYQLRAGPHGLSIPMQADLSADEQLITEIQSKLKECSTDGTLRKQFKLRLPTNAAKDSKNYLDLSDNCGLKDSSYSKLMFRKQSNQNKLSITERLMRIELLEREDRVHSHKLYSNKEKGFERENRKYLNGKIASQITEEGSNRFNQNCNQPNRKQNQLKNIRFSSGPQQADNSHPRNAATGPLKHFSPNLEVFIDKTPPDVPSVASKEEERSSKEICLASEECSVSDSRTIKKDRTSNPSFSKINNLEGIVYPQNLFSSIQQKLTLRETQARQTFNLSHHGENTKNQIEPQGTTSVEGSFLAVSRQSSMLRKRREKKITDEYMKVLEERGRRILELDYEGD